MEKRFKTWILSGTNCCFDFLFFNFIFFADDALHLLKNLLENFNRFEIVSMSNNVGKIVFNPTIAKMNLQKIKARVTVRWTILYVLCAGAPASRSYSKCKELNSDKMINVLCTCIHNDNRRKEEENSHS